MRAVFLLALALCAGGCQANGGEKLQLPPAPATKAVPSAVSPAKVAAKSTLASGSTTASTPAPAPAPLHGFTGSLLTGTTAARRTSSVSAGGSGLLEALLVQEGDYIEANQVIARLDRRDARLRVRQAEVGVQAARVQLDAARREVTRLERLAKDAAIATAELDRVRTAHDAAVAGVAQAEAAVAMARKMDSDADVRAPFAGLVTQKLKAEGEWISTMPPAPIIALAEVSPLELRVEVPANMIARVKAGDRLRARLTALDQTVEATVARVVPAVQPQTRMFTVVAELPNADHAIPPGLFAEVELLGGGGEK